MEVTTLCAVVAALRVVPNRSQFFQYESVSVGCERPGLSSDLRVKRNTSKTLDADWSWQCNRTHDSSCVISDLYPLDSGLYWCESGCGGRSSAVAIAVTAGAVILESPALPLVEGQAVTLRCTTLRGSSNATAHFYKDGLLLGGGATRNLTIHRVSASDRGLYRCKVLGVGESPESRVTVTMQRPEAPKSHLAYAALPVVGVCLGVALVLLCAWRNRKGESDCDISYTDVTIAQDVQHRIRDEALDSVPTFYSTLNLATA